MQRILTIEVRYHMRDPHFKTGVLPEQVAGAVRDALDEKFPFDVMDVRTTKDEEVK